MKKKQFHFGRGNRKLSRKILIWNLPAISTCPGSSTECRKFCYALKAQRNYPNCLPSRQRNLEFSKREDFIVRIVEYLSSRKETIIRLHEAGDFWCPSYLESWKEIARQLKDKTFFAFSKTYFYKNFWKNVPKNLILIQSVESRFPQSIKWNKSTARVIDKVTELRKSEYLCPYYDKEHFEKCGITCSYCFSKLPKVKHIAFLKH